MDIHLRTHIIYPLPFLPFGLDIHAKMLSHHTSASTLKRGASIVRHGPSVLRPFFFIIVVWFFWLSSRMLHILTAVTLCLALVSTAQPLSSDGSKSQQQVVFRPSEECSTFQGEDSCRGSQVDYPPASVNSRRWQTPPPTHPSYASSNWQHFGQLQGYAQVEYNADHSEASVHVWTQTRRPVEEIFYRFSTVASGVAADAAAAGGEWTKESTVKFSKNDPLGAEGLVVEAWAPALQNATLVMDPVLCLARESPC